MGIPPLATAYIDMTGLPVPSRPRHLLYRRVVHNLLDTTYSLSFPPGPLFTHCLFQNHWAKTNYFA